MDLRHAQPGDLENLFQLWKEMQYPHSEYHPNYYPLTNEAIVEEKTRNHLLSMIGNESFCFPVAIEGCNLLGYCITTIHSKPPIFQPIKQLHILQVVVSKEQRRKGVFRKLLNFAIAWGVDQGASEVELMVDSRNPAIEAYSRCGFEVIQHKMVYSIQTLKGLKS